MYLFNLPSLPFFSQLIIRIPILFRHFIVFTFHPVCPVFLFLSLNTPSQSDIRLNDGLIRRLYLNSDVFIPENTSVSQYATSFGV